MNSIESVVLIGVLQQTGFLCAGLIAAAAMRNRPVAAHAAVLLSLCGVLMVWPLGWAARSAGVGMLPATVAVEIRHPPQASFAAPANTSEIASPGSSSIIAPLAARLAIPAAAAPVTELPALNDRADVNREPARAGAFPTWPIWVLWGVISAVVAIRFIRGLIASLHLYRDSTACADPQLWMALHAACRDLVLGRHIELRTSPRAPCPMIWCWGRPAVILPGGETGRELDWRAVMVHEIAHYVRKDHLSALLADVVCVLLPWHPLAWAARRRLATAAEQTCDDWAVRHAASKTDYANSLVAFVVPRTGFALAPAIVSTAGLKARVVRILLDNAGPVRLGRSAVVMAVLVAIAAATVACVSQPASVSQNPPRPSAEEPDIVAAFVDYWRQNAAKPNRGVLWERVGELARLRDPRIIPPLIGMIDADNTYDTIYGIGYFGLSEITGVDYSPFHDGAWWRRWWEANKSKYPPEVQAIPIPDLPKSNAGKAYTPYPKDIDTFDGKVRWLLQEFERLRERKLPPLGMSNIATEIAKHKDPRAIPTLIGVIDADNSYETVYGIGYFGLSPLTGVKYSTFHDGAWWRRWWEANRSKYPPEVQAVAIPELPRTRHGTNYTPFPADMDTYDGLIRKLLKEYADPQQSERMFSDIARELAKLRDLRAIPVLIGVIDADNSYHSIYGLGWFGLGELTGVSYSPYHDGAWWRRWWEANKSKYPPEAQAVPIPELPRTAHGRTYTPMPESFDTFDGKIAWLHDALATGRDVSFNDFAEALAAHKDPRAIPFFIGLIEADNTERTIYGIGHFGLRELTAVRYNAAQDGAWWRRWWEENRDRYPVARDAPIPDLKEAFATWTKGEQAREKARLDAAFTGFPCQDLRAAGDDRKRYFLMGPAEGQTMPENGWHLLLILPGGAGGPEFQNFCRTIHRDALPAGFIAAQLVAPAWSDDPNRTVWPTRMLNGDRAAFTTEDFIRAVVEDVAARLNLDRGRVLALGWSSSGPALYCDSLQPDTPIRGWLIAMSVFRPQWMPELTAATDRRYYLLHSPDDALISIEQHARMAEKRLREAGATVTLVEYAGGHGWTEDPVGHIRRGVEWLMSQQR